MSSDDRRIDDLVAAVTEGRPVDWVGLLDACQDDDSRRLVAQLKVLSDIARTTEPVPTPTVLFRWGQLEVLEELGRGAFGRVFRARDPRLDREVALKLYDRAGVGDGRLVREAQLLARIRHPHVVIAHGADSIDGRVGVWMELVRGRTLDDVLRTQGPFGPWETTLIGIDLCRALSAVHGARLVHRDIKCSNVMRETGGRIVLMDFGAGVPRDGGPHGDDVTTGSPLYMAPELLEGAEASNGTDVYALGVLLFHLVTGAYPVRGSSLAELRDHHARQVRTSLREARPDAPAALTRVIDRALSPSPAARFRSAADMERALAATLDLERPVAIAPVRPWLRWWSNPRVRATVGLAAIPSLVAATLFGGGLRDGFPAERGVQPPDTFAFIVEAPDALRFADGPGLLAVSPDGGRIAFATAMDQTATNLPMRLWMRRLGSLVAEPIAGTETGNQPFWSPDGRFLGFSALSMELKRVDVTGGSVVTLADWGVGGTWNSEGVILFTGRDGLVHRVSQDGGEPAAVTRLDPARDEARHLWPSFLPDGRRFLFMAEGSSSERTVYVASLDSPARTPVINVASRAEYAAGHLFYQREGTLLAQQFDIDTAQLVDEARPVAASIRFAGDGRSAFSVSRNGVIVYATQPAGADVSSLAWFDSSGKRLAAVGEPGTYAYPNLSPDGSRLAVYRLSADRLWDIWTVNLVRNVATRFTFNSQVDRSPIVWSPDGSYLVYAAQEDKARAFDLYRRSLSGASTDEKLFESADDKQAGGVSPDGSVLLFNRELGKGHGTDIWALSLTGARAAQAVLESPSDEESGVFSPDGRWFAYASNESGAFQVYAQPFPPTGRKLQLSRDGGGWPRWTTDDRVFYSTEGRLWSVDVSVNGSTLQAGVPRALFSQAFVGSRFGAFVAERTGSRFLLVVPDHTEPSSLHVLVNPLGASPTGRR